MTSLISSNITFSKVQQKFDNFESEYKAIKKIILEKMQDSLLINLKRLAPRNTGSYADSWEKGEITENTAKIVTEQGILFAILEFTGSRVPAQQRKPPQKPFVFKDKSGNTVFTFKIKAKGFDKIPHAEPAMKLTIKEIGTFMKEELSKIFK